MHLLWGSCLAPEPGPMSRMATVGVSCPARPG